MASSGAWKDQPALICRNVTVSGRRTSLRMEPLLWDSLKDICEREDLTLNELCTQIDSRRGEANLTASIRVFIISYYRAALKPPARGHGRPGLEEPGQPDIGGRPPHDDLLDRALAEAVPLPGDRPLRRRTR